MSTYKTLKGTSTSLYKEKGSKFYGYAFPIDSTENIKEKLAQIQEEHPKARHICTALLIGSENDEYFLTNDDGEPSNSAGAPILGQIRSHEITNTFIAVVRYFGGVKLGVGGLIQAYKQTALEAIQANTIIEVEPQGKLTIRVSYNELGSALSIIDKNNLRVEVENLPSESLLTISCDAKDVDRIAALFERIEAKIERF